MSTNDQLLQDLHKWAGETLGLHPLVNVVDGLRAGLDWSPALACASYSPSGQEVITFDAAYVDWPPEQVKSVFMHECEHLRAGHVAKAARVSTVERAPVQLTQGDAIRWRYHEAQADAAAEQHVKRFNQWQQQRQLEHLQQQVWELRQLVLGRQLGQQLAASKPQRKAIQPKFGRGGK